VAAFLRAEAAHDQPSASVGGSDPVVAPLTTAHPPTPWRAMPTPINQSIVTGLALLRAVLKHDGPCGSRQLARDLDMAQAKVVRLTTTLCSLGLLRRTAAGKYRPGPGLHVLAGQALVGSGLVAAAMPALKRLHGAGWTVALGVLWQEEVCYLVHARPTEQLVDRVGVHHLVPLETSSLGLVLAAHSPTGRRRRGAAGIRKAGHARLDFPDGEVSLAVAIGDEPVAALGLSRPRPGPSLVESTLACLHREATGIAERLLVDDRPSA